MGINVTFSLGQGSSKFSAVSLKIYDLGTVPPTLLSDTTPAATDEEATVELPEDKLLQAVLTKTAVGGVVGNPAVLNFSTGISSISFPSGDLRILTVEETSSTSSLSTSSTSSLSSSSLSSTSSPSSSSPSSSSSTSSLSSTSTSSLSSLSSSSTSSLSSSSTSSISSSSSSG